MGAWLTLLAACAPAPAQPPVVSDDESAVVGQAGSALPAPPATAPSPPPAIASTPPSKPPLPPGVTQRPAWLGTRVLPLRADGFGEIQPTPPELVDRRLVTVDHLPPPAADSFEATVVPVPDDVLNRSTWSPGCPVASTELRYLTVTFWGFDEQAHTGELLVNQVAADDLVMVFRRLYEMRFPIEEMRVVAAEELDYPPTGDGNNTTAFVCRPARGQTSWSEHAYGLAVDVNPFHNPYSKGDVVLPELASAYLDRDWHRPGMIQPGDEAVQAFTARGWGWGGTWRSSKDWMHFSATGG